MAVIRPPVTISAVDLAEARMQAGMKNTAVNIGGGAILYKKKSGKVVVRKASAPGAGGKQTGKLKACKGKDFNCIREQLGAVSTATERTGGQGSKRCYTKKDGSTVCYTVRRGKKVPTPT